MNGINPTLLKEFDQAYFENYGPEKSNYSQVWQKNSFLPTAIQQIGSHFTGMKSLLILGSATGEPMEFANMNGFSTSGIEVSSWACSKLSSKLKNRVHYGHVAELLPRLALQGQYWDVIFSSCLQFLSESEIRTVLRSAKSICKVFCHYGGFKGQGDDELDLKLKTLQSYSWWKDLFREEGFELTETPYFWSPFTKTNS